VWVEKSGSLILEKMHILIVFIYIREVLLRCDIPSRSFTKVDEVTFKNDFWGIFCVNGYHMSRHHPAGLELNDFFFYYSKMLNYLFSIILKCFLNTVVNRVKSFTNIYHTYVVPSEQAWGLSEIIYFLYYLRMLINFLTLFESVFLMNIFLKVCVYI